MTKRTVGFGLLVAAVIAAGAAARYLGTTTTRACADLLAFGAAGEASSDFPTNYALARQRFLEATRTAGGEVASQRNPQTGPGGEPLFMDVVLFGPEAAERTLVVSSATHGVEGFAGSGIQTRLLREGFASRLPQGVNLLMIHGINPYGMAHWRRFNEDNVDLNRNFRDHSSPPPEKAYATLADVFAPPSMGFWSEAQSWARIGWSFYVTPGRVATQAAFTGGQFSEPEGLFYGGAFETWSNTTLRSVVARYVSEARRVVHVDIHTGLGEFAGATVLLNVAESSPAHERALGIWGADLVETTATGNSISSDLDASLKRALPAMLPFSEVTAVSVEFGTVPGPDAATALRAENWLVHHGAPDHPRADEFKTCLLRAFHPGTATWEAAIWEQGRDVIELAVASLAPRL